MKRRVIKQGNNTLTITLPRKWANEININAGDEIELKEEGNKLTIVSSKDPTQKTYNFALKSSEKIYVYQILRNLYNSDIDNMELTYQDPKTLSVIQEFAPRFLGWEFLEQDETHCKIKNYATYNEENFKELYRKVFINTTNMMKEIGLTLDKKKEIDLKNILVFNDTIHRFANYCRKMLTKSLYSLNQNRAHSHFLTNLIIISTNLRMLAEYLSENKVSSAPVLKYYHQLTELYNTTHLIFVQKSAKELMPFIIKGEELLHQGISELENSRGHDPVVFHYLITIVQLIKDQGGRLMVIVEEI